MSRRQKTLLLLAFPLVAMVSALLVGQGSNLELVPSSSSYSAGPAGTKALYLLLQELKLSPSRYRRPFRDLASLTGTMIVANPQYVEFTRKQGRDLEAWVKKGNRLIVFEAARAWSTLPKASYGQYTSFSGRRVRGPARYFGLRMKEFPDKPRKTLTASLPGLTEEINISVSCETRWSKPSPAWTVLAKDESGPLLLTKKLGDGQVFACSDPSIISNRYLDREQNLRLALGLVVGKDRRGAISFDEFHHGYRLAESFWTYVGSSVFAWVFFQIAIGFAFFFYSRRAELAGRFRSLAPRGGRSTTEYVDSMADIFESCKADSAALEAILDRFLGRVSRVLGIPLKGLDRASLSKSAIRLPGGTEDLSGLIEKCRRVIRTGETREIVAMARELAIQESTLGDRRTLSKR
jgi:hypothetical protein